MKIRAFVVLILVVCGILVTAFYVNANRTSAGEKAIIEAIQTKNTPLLIQSLIKQMNEQMEKDTESLPELIKEVEKYTQACTDSTGVAVLHSMIAQMYDSYYTNNRWKINQRTNLEGYVPEDIREWTTNLFQDKIKSELTASLQPAGLLQETQVSQFDAILTKGKDSPELRPTLYDFLAFRAISIQPSAEWYNALLAFRRTQTNTKALVMDELDWFNFYYSDKPAQSSEYLSKLDSLFKQYEKEPFAAEICIARLQVLQSQSYRGTPEQNDSIKGVIYSTCKECIARYPKYERISSVKNTLTSLENPQLRTQAGHNIYPGKNLSIQIQYQNTPKLIVRIYQSLRQPELAWKNYPKNQKQRGKLLKETVYDLPLKNSYTQYDTTLTIPMEQLGLYEYTVSTPDNNLETSARFSVSRLGILTRGQNNGTTDVLVTDVESGKPIEGANVTYYKTNTQGNPVAIGHVKTDRYGLAILPAKQRFEAVRPTFREDTMAVLTSVYPAGTYRPQEKEQIELSLFTDRGLYRPGQTVFFKGIAYVKDTDNPHVVANRTFSVSLRDANYQEVANKKLTTDQFGSFNGEFTIPQSVLSGSFSITSDRGQTNIRVEEYKRPTFQVAISPLEDEVFFGKPVKIEGSAKTFSGVALQTGEIKWQISKRPFWLRLYMPYFSDFGQVASGTTTVDEKGNFSFSFVPERMKNDFGRPVFQTYEVTATLTDSKGETQEAQYTFSVGDSGILLTIRSEQQMERDSATANVSAFTINGKEIPANGTYKIYALDEKVQEKSAYGIEQFKINKEVASGNFSTGQAIPNSVFRTLVSGRYRLEVKAADRNGKEITTDTDFILYDKKDKRPPVFMHTWLIKEKTTCLPGEDAEFIFGTSDKQAYILYEIYDANRKCIERKRFEMSDENRTFRIPFKESDGNGFTVLLTFVKAGETYMEQIPVTRQLPDRKLTIRPETFRNHLLPGSKENWKFRITNADSMAVSAQVLASMYDASLDQIMPFAWSFVPQCYINIWAPGFNPGSAFTTYTHYDNVDIKYLKVIQFQYDQLNWLDVLNSSRFYSNRPYGMMTKSARGVSVYADAAPMVENAVAVEGTVLQENAVADIIAEEEIEIAPANRQAQLRENFAETAFFYPALVTDAEGNVSFDFTMPESNTTWKLQLLAQTEDLKYGYLSEKVITSKPLMVVPNLPRFMRQGDEVSISTQVINQSDKAITGRVTLELLDPATEQPVVCLSKSQKPFDLAAGNTTTVSWTLPVPTTTDLVICRIIADSENGSDGEQHLIPVLSDKILITESTPFFLMGQGEQAIQLPSAKSQSGRTPFRMTLELTANPVWYAVQALPTITQPDNENIISWFAAYYSNTLASYIANSHPRIQKVINQWKAQGGTASTLLSNLEKNEELKNILLQETPWVLEADNETEQKQRLSLLFDLNRASQQRAAALEQLLKQQTPDGGWSWFKGMYPSREITLYILNGMAQLTQLNAIEYNQQEKEMQIKALNFLDKQIQQDYEQLTANTKDWQKTLISPLQLNYLFVRSSYRDIPELGEAREAIRFYTARAEKEWNKQSLYGKGETALLMLRNGKKDVANSILAWLRKTATTSTEKGMYWANNRRDNNFFISPLDTHCLLMSVFNELSPNTQETDRMKQWLLNQKRTQNWESVPATVNAIYALLLTGSDWLNTNNACTVKWGNNTYSTNEGEAATGYLKVVLPKKNKNTAGNTISVHKEGSAPAWGAVYDQYFEKINQVQKQKGVLNVEKKLFAETNNGSERQLRPVSPEQPLRIGDKVVVRLTIRTDREMDYVFLKDLRAGCFEPATQISGSTWRDGAWYYQSPTDVSENFFFNSLPEGTYVLEYSAYVSREGRYSGGISTIQCLYAPEFVSHTEGGEITVN